MIDSIARNKLAELIRSFVSGLMTNDQFEDAIPVSKDAAIDEVFNKGAWFLYDDLREYKLTGKDILSIETKSQVARWVLFLKTDYEYEWPSVSFKERLFHKLSFGLFGTSMNAAWSEAGDVNLWPFLSIESLNSAKLDFGYLSKKSGHSIIKCMGSHKNK